MGDDDDDIDIGIAKADGSALGSARGRRASSKGRRANSTRQLGTCGACSASNLKIQNDLLSLHGYSRPGHGYIEGRCPGSKQPALEVSRVTLEIGRDLVQQVVAQLQRKLNTLEQTDEIREEVGGRVVVYRKDDYIKNPRVFEDKRREKILSVTAELKYVEQDLVRFETAISQWKPTTFIDVEEVERGKQDRKDKVRLDRLEKYGALLSKTREKLRADFTKLLAAESKLKEWYSRNEDLPGGNSPVLDKGVKLSIDVFSRAKAMLDWSYRGPLKLVDAHPDKPPRREVIESLGLDEIWAHLGSMLRTESGSQAQAEPRERTLHWWTERYQYTADYRIVSPQNWPRPTWPGFLHNPS